MSRTPTKSRRSKRAIWMLLLSLLAASAIGLAYGCARVVNRTAERKIREMLPGAVGTASEWTAHVDSPPARTLRGQLSHLVIHGRDVQIHDVIRLDELDLETEDVDVDIRRQKLRSVGRTTFRAAIGEDAINKYVHDHPPAPDDPVLIDRVTVRQGDVLVEGSRRVGTVPVKFSLTTVPTVTSPTKVEFVPEKMRVIGVRVPIPQAALRWIARRLSQGLDLSTMPFPITVSTLNMEPGRVVVIGDADVMGFLNDRMGGR